MSVDLKDTFLLVPIILKHRKFLRFLFKGVQFRYNCLPIGYSQASRSFCKCMEMALEPLRSKGIRPLFYQDNLIVIASSKESMALQTALLVKHLCLLSFAINWGKSTLLPSQSIIYLGVHMNSLKI